MKKSGTKIIVCLFFAAYLALGVIIFKDYGISWDEPISRTSGTIAMNYVMHGDQELLTYSARYHGTAFDLFLVAIEKMLNLSENLRALYFTRHLVTFFLFYAGAFFFYLLCKDRFGWKMGLLGSLFLILSPRVFAHSFYNSKDIAFLAMFIISIYTLIRYLDKKTVSRAILHALVSAILIDIRILGIIVPFFTLIFSAGDLLAAKPKESENKNIIASFLTYAFFLICFTVLFWPVLWSNPPYHFIKAFEMMRRYPWYGIVLYLGNYTTSINLPWHYIPLWIVITTPVLYTACFFLGCFAATKLLLKNPIQFCLNKRNDLIYLLWFFLPLATIVIFKSVLYDAWRQMFFIYPAFLILSLIGLSYLFEYIKVKFQGLTYRIVNAVFILVIIFSLINTSKFMLKYHPYQNLYFNVFAGKDMKEVKNNFELDYWGLSYRKALEYILENDKDETIKICVANWPGMFNAFILNSDDRDRLVYVKNPEEAKYFLSNYRGHREEYPYEEEYYSIKIGGTKIIIVYKVG